MSDAQHPRLALFDAQDLVPDLPVVDHYCGVETRMRKSLELQAEMGPVFDITLDCEDGAPIGAEAEHAELVASLAGSGENRWGRVGARVHPFDHASFAADVETLVGRAGERLAYLMVPKPRHALDVERAVDAIDSARSRHGVSRVLPIHVLIETHGALRDVQRIAAHPRIESLSFGLMDFVSAHRGAIPRSAMEVPGQFEHPLVARAKLEIAAAAHAHAKTPSHCVVTEFKDSSALEAAATRAAREFGYTRMWSIHPSQIQPILDAFSPTTAEVDEAIEIITAAQAAHWAPIQHRQRLHDRASYRFFWQIIERAHRAAQPLPTDLRATWFGTPPSGQVRT
jgi:citrate lyase subunit beta/citryl-CoA lyase